MAGKIAAMRPFHVFLLLLVAVTGGAYETIVVLEMPNFAVKGSSITLYCNHNVPPDLLYMASWRKAGKIIFKYVTGRMPPYIHHQVEGCRINLSMSNQHSLVLQDLTFSASGDYTCEVTLEAPVYTKPSQPRDLLVIQPQKHMPKISFGAQTYTLDDVLEATCTSSPSYPPPHITWIVNGEKVDESKTVPTTTNHRRIPGSMEMLASATTKLKIPVSSLGLAPGAGLTLTCLATIPASKGPSGQYGDITNHTVIVEVRTAEEPETTTAIEIMDILKTELSSSSVMPNISYILLLCQLCLSLCKCLN